MEASLATRLERFAAGEYQPTTFLERGVAVPFTTPLLLGARVRPAARAGLDMVVAHQSGTRGHYVLPWSAVPDICSPTLHDRLLWRAVQGLGIASPPGIRAAARAVARQGAAGRAAATAAADAVAGEQAARLTANFELLLMLVRVMEGPDAAPPVQHDSPRNQEARARRAVARLAAQLGVAPDAVATRLEGLAGAYAGIGTAPHAPARVPALLAQVAALADALGGHARVARDPAEVTSAEVIEEATRLTLAAARKAISLARLPLAGLGRVLALPAAEDARLGEAAARPDWLLDGWDTLHAIWHAAAPADRPAALQEMAVLVPVIPREVLAWTGEDFAWDGNSRLRRLMRAQEDWRGGTQHLMVDRNERLRALAA